MKLTTIVALLALIVVGCARDPVTPSNIYDEPHKLKPASDADSGPYRLFGEWTFYIDESHENIEVVPKRQKQFHFNAMKYLEGGPCYDCVRIDSISPGAEPGTINIEVAIRNPFPSNNLAYTGFDVKGILMFSSSYSCIVGDWPEMFPPDGGPARISWRERGDPEVLNPDGYSFRWSPSYSDYYGYPQPVLKYIPGKYSMGVPDAHINAHKNFYTHEKRHMFLPGYEVKRTYIVWLPPGPVIAGYAVEACWEPPIVTPVGNPETDFPITANQPEPYLFTYEWNNGEPISDPGCCAYDTDCDDESIFYERWYGEGTLYKTITMENWGYISGTWLSPCDNPDDGYHGTYLTWTWMKDGKYRWLVVLYDYDLFPQKSNLTFTLIDLEVQHK